MLVKSLLAWKPSPVGGKVDARSADRLGVSRALYLNNAKVKKLPHPSSVDFVDSFPPRGKLKDTLPKGLAKVYWLGSLSPRFAYSRELYRRTFRLTPIRGKVDARSADRLGVSRALYLINVKLKGCLTPHQSTLSTASPHGGSLSTRCPRAWQKHVGLEAFTHGGRWMHEVQTDEGLGDFNFLSETRFKSTSIAHHSSAECNRNGGRHGSHVTVNCAECRTANIRLIARILNILLPTSVPIDSKRGKL